MAGKTNSGLRCAEFEALLAEALDGTLSEEQRAGFERHKADCQACGKLFFEVTCGRAWLEELEDIEPPRNLVHNILAATTGVAQQMVQAELRLSTWERFRHQVGKVFAPVLTPRFAMSMGMAFFSVTLVLNMAQIRIKDLTAHNLSHAFYSSESKLVKHYENIRLVYEIESRVRDLRNSNGKSERELRDRHLEENNNRSQEQHQSNEQDGRSYSEFSYGQSVRLLASLNGDGHSFGLCCGDLGKQRRAL